MKVALYWSHSFLPELIQPDGLVYDFGVYDGGFARLVASRCQRVIGFEPDPRWNTRSSLPHNVRVVPKALAARAGARLFNVNAGLCSSLHFSTGAAQVIEVEALTLETALAEEPDGRIDLLKMDIEGEEVQVLLQAPSALFQRVVHMTVEFHDFLDPSSVPGALAVIDRMRGLGFFALCFSVKSHADVMFVNLNLVPLSTWHKAWLTVRYKYVRGLGRVTRRTLGKYIS